MSRDNRTEPSFTSVGITQGSNTVTTSVTNTGTITILGAASPATHTEGRSIKSIDLFPHGTPTPFPGMPVGAVWSTLSNSVTVFCETPARTHDIIIVQSYGQIPDGFKYVCSVASPSLVLSNTALQIQANGVWQPVQQAAPTMPSYYHVYRKQHR